MTSQPCTQKRPPENTAQIWTTDMYSQTDETQSSRTVQAVCEHNARVKLQSIDWGQCTSTSVQAQVNW